MAQQPFTMGTGLEMYRDGRSNHVTFVLTEDCNLRCSYCYLVHKNSQHVMPLAVARRAIDFLLDMPRPQASLVVEFTGGEATLELDLVRQIIHYFQFRLRRSAGHPWRSAHMFQLSTNGTTYHTPPVQRLIWEQRGHLAVAITLDGTQRKHDMHRVFVDGRGSYGVVAANVKLWLRQFPGSLTKVTFASEDLPYLVESILHLYDLGLRSVAANVVFENVWRPGDAELFEDQLRRLADAIIERDLWQTHRCTLFWQPPGSAARATDGNWCGTGRMMSIDSEGRIFPCVRFQSYSLATPGRCERSLGDIYQGLNADRLRAFHGLRRSLQSPPQCLRCTMSDGCAWCTGFNYDSAASDTIFQRATFICEMHKARYRANLYYWRQLEKRCGIQPDPATTAATSCPI